MVRWLRVIAAVALAMGMLEAANWAVRDCSTGLGTAENCLWLQVRRSFGLPASKVLRAGVLEVTGLVILAGIYGAFRYVWPRRKEERPSAHCG